MPACELESSARAARRIRDLLLARVNEHKLRLGSCAACGRKVKSGDNPATRHEYCCLFDFDHQDPELKIDGISKLVILRKPLSQIAKEIELCLLICANCHRLKSCHKSRLTDREQNVFNILKKGHSREINPYDGGGGTNYFLDTKAFLDYSLRVATDVRERDNHDWRRPDNSFLVALPLPLLSSNNTTSFSQISWSNIRYPCFVVSWYLTYSRKTTQSFPPSRYNGDLDVALGAALVFRARLRARGIPYKEFQEDDARAQELMAKFRQFLADQSSTPSFSQISFNKQAFIVTWTPVSGTPRHVNRCFGIRRYDGESDIALGAALTFREQLRACGIRYRPHQEEEKDLVKAQMYIASYQQFLLMQASSSMVERIWVTIATSRIQDRRAEKLLARLEARKKRKRPAAVIGEGRLPKRLAVATPLDHPIFLSL